MAGYDIPAGTKGVTSPLAAPITKKKKSLLQTEIFKKRVKREEIMHFSRQMASFMRAGIPILDALQVIGDDASNSRFKGVLDEIGHSLRAGSTFSAAVAAHRDVFPSFYVSILRSAELTGHLDNVMDELSGYIQRDLDARRKIRSAMIYPAVIMVMSLFTVLILTAFVLPRFRTFFTALDAELPLATRAMLTATGFLGRWWYAILAGLMAGGLALFLASQTGPGRQVRDAMLLRLPVLRDVIREAIVERFCRILSSMVQAGVPLPDAMLVAAEATNNLVYRRALSRAREAMMQGEGLARPIHATGLFPSAANQMMRVGENTGTLDDQLATAASFYEQELDYRIKRLTTLFEPAVIIVMGLIVGFVAVALVSAMYGIFNQVQVQ
jgi:type IV pilus assembly protein PilC